MIKKHNSEHTRNKGEILEFNNEYYLESILYLTFLFNMSLDA